ncbi:MAG TPA: hypothetical protein PLQ13_05485 [Candidatus Krumholzibacteria bacterium]|nr:hypothetical protein [Candidatus Krumholzibacteria bacterium]
MNARFRPLLLSALALALALAGCSSDDPTSPAPEPSTGMPRIPTLADYGGNLDNIPDQSEVIVTGIEPWQGPFVPSITDMNTSYSYYLTVDVPLVGPVTLSGGTQTGWASSIFFLVSFHEDIFNRDYVLDSSPYQAGPLRFVLARNGAPVTSPSPLGTVGWADDGDGTSSYAWTVNSRVWGGITEGFTSERRPLEIRVSQEGIPTLAEAPYLKRELYWQLSNINGDPYKIIDPGYHFGQSTTYTTGVSETESYEFFWSLTTSVSGGYGPVSASVSASVGETFGTSVTVSEQTSVTVTEDITAPAGKTIMASRWQLMERYTVCTADGAPFAADGLHWRNMTLEVPGVNRVFIEDYPGQ